jgi:hypothetical protein
MTTKVECESDRKVMDSWSMNNVLKNNEISEADTVKLVDLWTTAKRVESELVTLKRLIDALPTHF